MTLTTGISFLGSSQAQIGRLTDLQKNMTDLLRQTTTGKKYDDFSGFGFDSLTLQRSRMDKSRLESYQNNITTVTTRINVMETSMKQAADLGRQLMSSIQGQVRDGTVDLESIKTLAKDSLDFMRDLVNTQVDGRFVFSGSSSGTTPLASLNQANNNYQSQITNWLNGTTSSAQLIANTDAFTTTDLGFDPSLSASGPVSLRIDQTTEIDYTIMGNSNGFDKIISALTFASNLQQPNPATDVPTQQEMNDMLDHILSVVKQGVNSMDQAQAKLGSKINLIKSMQENHTQDIATLSNVIGDIENADTTEVIAKLQALQTQMTASYQVTNVVSQLSLVNYLS